MGIKKTLRKLAKAIKHDLGLDVLEVMLNDHDAIEVELLSVPAEHRREGRGSEALRRIIKFADGLSLPVELYVGRNAEGVPNPDLVRLYGGLGFHAVTPGYGDMVHEAR